MFSAATNAKYASGQGSLYALELRGFDTGTSGASFEHPTYTDPNRCVGGRTCQWTVAPAEAGDYQYKVFVLDLIHDKVYAKCPTGTSCAAPKKIPLPVGEEISWVVQLNTTKGNKATGGFKTCLKGVAKSKKA